MRGLRLERFVKANLSEEEAEKLYRLGKGAVVWALLEITARWKEAVGAVLRPGEYYLKVSSEIFPHRYVVEPIFFAG